MHQELQQAGLNLQVVRRKQHRKARQPTLSQQHINKIWTPARDNRKASKKSAHVSGDRDKRPFHVGFYPTC